MIKPEIIKSIRINGIRPYSVNRFKDGRIHSRDYKKWKSLVNNVFTRLPHNFLPSDLTNFDLGLEIGAYKQFDLDNTLKAYIDALEHRYGFNDNGIKRILAKKVDVDPDINDEYLKVFLLERVEYGGDEIQEVDDINHLVIDIPKEIYYDIWKASEKKGR